MKTVRLLGLGNRRYLLLKEHLQTISETELGRFFEVEEINNLDEILRFRPASVPALIVNNTIVYENGHDPQLEEITQLIRNQITKSIQMQNILVPIDYSPCSIGAYQYAQRLNALFGGEIKVMHTVDMVIDGTGKFYEETYETLLKSSQARLNEFTEKNASDVTVTTAIQTEVTIGYADKEIVRYSKEQSPDLIVMGTTGEGGLLKKTFGSVSTYVAKHAHCPVLFIPEEYAFKPYKNILYASNQRAIDELVLKSMYQLWHSFNPELHMVHIEKQQSGDMELSEMKTGTLIPADDKPLTFRDVSIRDRSIEGGLQKYIQQYEIDLLVMLTEHRSFVEDLFHQSITRRMLRSIQIPLLIMHL